MKKEILFIIAGVILLLIIIFLIYRYLKYNEKHLSRRLLKRKIKYDKLIEISYSCGGDVNGKMDYIVIDLLKKKITSEYKAYYTDPITIREYEYPDNILELENKIREYNLPAYKDIPLNPFLIQKDASIKTITFVYDNSSINGNKNEYYTIDFNMGIPKDARNRLNEVVDLVLSYKRTCKIIKETKKKK